MKDFHRMTIAGLERDLPLCKVTDHLQIAAFVIFGDVELTIASAKEILERVPEFDFIVTPEAKSIPLAYEMSRQSGKKYFVARKGAKLYMHEPVHIDVRSITTAKTQSLYLDGSDGEELRDKRVLIVDDVISTGESLNAVLKLVESFDGNIVGAAAILAEGDAAKRDDIIFLEKLPLFFN
ncbi:MAG TPA: adenine phosphoribosyltransferase [Clostridiales bacterium]|nr:adenine phosphoribosyltransferase [Clostridiales bacterium]